MLNLFKTKCEGKHLSLVRKMDRTVCPDYPDQKLLMHKSETVLWFLEDEVAESKSRQGFAIWFRTIYQEIRETGRMISISSPGWSKKR